MAQQPAGAGAAAPGGATPPPRKRPDIREWVWDFPIQPAIEATTKRLKVIWANESLADSRKAYRVLEMGHGPVFFFPPGDVAMEWLRPTEDRMGHEWLGVAQFWDVVIGSKRLNKGCISMPEPVAAYNKLKNYFAFTPQKVDAVFVDGTRMKMQRMANSFSWIGPEILGPLKGEPGAEERIKLMNLLMKDRAATGDAKVSKR